MASEENIPAQGDIFVIEKSGLIPTTQLVEDFGADEEGDSVKATDLVSDLLHLFRICMKQPVESQAGDVHVLASRVHLARLFNEDQRACNTDIRVAIEGFDERFQPTWLWRCIRVENGQILSLDRRQYLVDSGGETEVHIGADQFHPPIGGPGLFGGLCAVIVGAIVKHNYTVHEFLVGEKATQTLGQVIATQVIDDYGGDTPITHGGLRDVPQRSKGIGLPTSAVGRTRKAPPR